MCTVDQTCRNSYVTAAADHPRAFQNLLLLRSCRPVRLRKDEVVLSSCNQAAANKAKAILQFEAGVSHGCGCRCQVSVGVGATTAIQDQASIMPSTNLGAWASSLSYCATT